MDKFKLLFIFTLTLLVQNIYAQTTTNGTGYSQSGNTTYATKYAENDKYTVLSLGNTEKALTINFEYPINKITYSAWLSSSVSESHTVTLTAGSQTHTTELNNDSDTDGIFKPDKDNDYQEDEVVSITDTSIRTIKFNAKRNGWGIKDIYLKNIFLYMAPHIILKDTPLEHSFGTLEIGNSSEAFNVKFHSFLSEGTLSVKIKGANPEAFRVSNTINATNNTLSPIGETKYNFTITYDPNTIGDHSAIIEISDNKNKHEIEVSGTCIAKTPKIEWAVSNFKIAVGDTIENPAKTNSGTTIRYTSNDTLKIKIEGQKLIAQQSGDVEITATSEAGNNFKEVSIKATFTATSKTIQYIDWDQNFHRLKINDGNQNLTAVAKDKETNQTNSNPITYTSADENIVRIEGNSLVIVGIGQTSITASTEETETYAGASQTKVVFVREATDDCSDSYIINDTEVYSESYNTTSRTITKTFEWNETIGETLTFVASGNISEVTARDNTNNTTIELSSANNIYTGAIKRNTRSVTITVKGSICIWVWQTYTISLSNVFVTPLSFVEPEQNEIIFSATEIEKKANEYININWANQHDYLSASIINDATGAFDIADAEATYYAACGEFGSFNVHLQYNPQTEGTHNANLIIKHTDKDSILANIPLSGSAIYCETQYVVDGDWNNVANWSNGIPGAGKNTIITAKATIPNNYTAEVHDLRIGDNGKITIAPQGILKVEATINNTTNENLTLQADENGSAILLFKNEENNKVNATVELYSLASSDGLRNGQPGNFKDPKWQYIGICAETVPYTTLNADGTSNWIYSWDETQNATSCWAEKLKSTSTLSAWRGYCLAQESATTYSYTGTLLNADQTYQLTFTQSQNSTDDLGNNLIANSYTAPIDITTLSEANFSNAIANIYIYNTGSWLEWKQQTNAEGFNPGQVIAIPVNTVSTLGNDYPRTIASGQAFFVKAQANGATFQVDYENNVYNAGSTNNQKRTRRTTDEEFNVLKIQITSETSNDRLYLLEHENTSAEFDNGYDAEKIFDNPNGPQVYATVPWGYTSINTDTSFNGQAIGFKANSDNELYTMTFDINKLYNYDELYVYDTETELYIDIFNTEIYQFYGSTTPNDNRFIITSTSQGTPESGGVATGIENVTNWNSLLQQNQPIYVYTATGQLISILNSNSTTYLPELPTGMYIVKSGEYVMKINIQK